MSFRKSLIAFAALALMITGSTAEAGLTGVFSTGAGLAPGAVDTHYSIASTFYTGQASVTPFIPPSYSPPAAGSNYISSPGDPAVPNGVYTYTTSFSSDNGVGFLAVTLTADDTVSVSLNGGPTLFTTPDQGYSALYSFVIGSGFISGMNTLTFTVTNTHQVYEALDVSLSAVPEPASMAMVALGLGGIFAARRFRRRAV